MINIVPVREIDQERLLYRAFRQIHFNMSGQTLTIDEYKKLNIVR